MGGGWAALCLGRVLFIILILLLFILVPSASPQDINIVNISSHAVSMTWEAIDREEAHGILRGYRLFYRLARLNETWSNVSVTDLIGDVPVLSLRSYEIRMCGYTAVGNGVFSRTYIANTTGFGKCVPCIKVINQYIAYYI